MNDRSENAHLQHRGDFWYAEHCDLSERVTQLENALKLIRENASVFHSDTVRIIADTALKKD